jgi:hypothetical protein
MALCDKSGFCAREAFYLFTFLDLFSNHRRADAGQAFIGVAAVLSYNCGAKRFACHGATAHK